MTNKEIAKKKVFVRTFGCQMNTRDSEFAAGILLERGFREAKGVKDADVILFNSCSVRKHAEDRLFSNIAELKDLKKKKPGLLIGLIGCTAQRYKDKILERAPLVDFVCGPGNEAELPRLIADLLKDRCAVIAVDKVNEKRPELFPRYRKGSSKAYVSIGEGCDNFCSYCIVPYVRGRERSREAADILREARDLAARGFREITLLGQNVNSYRLVHSPRSAVHSKGKGFIKLLESLNRIDGIERIRFMTSHPKDATADLFKAMRDLDKVCRHLHLPLQSGSDRILGLMNRGYTKTKYIRLAENYRKILPSGSITTDIIAGFPSEKDRDFRSTVETMKEISFDGAFVFKYSPRPPAKASGLKDDVPEDVKQDRLAEILRMQSGISEMRNAPLVGSTVEVLIDGKSENAPGTLTGRSRENKSVIFKGAEGLVGKIVNVKIESVTPYALRGERV